MGCVDTEQIQTLLRDVKTDVRASCDFERVKEVMTNGHAKPVIVCDDDPHDRKVLVEIISRCNENYSIVEVADGDECLRAIEEAGVIVALFIDLRMPKMDGYEVLRRIRDRGFLKVVVTGFDITEQDRKLLKGLCDRWIRKPKSVADKLQLEPV